MPFAPARWSDRYWPSWTTLGRGPLRVKFGSPGAQLGSPLYLKNGRRQPGLLGPKCVPEAEMTNSFNNLISTKDDRFWYR
jgi:hypothetical protein